MNGSAVAPAFKLNCALCNCWGCQLAAAADQLCWGALPAAGVAKAAPSGCRRCPAPTTPWSCCCTAGSWSTALKRIPWPPTPTAGPADGMAGVPPSGRWRVSSTWCSEKRGIPAGTPGVCNTNTHDAKIGLVSSSSRVWYGGAGIHCRVKQPFAPFPAFDCPASPWRCRACRPAGWAARAAWGCVAQLRTCITEEAGPWFWYCWTA